MFRLEPIFDRQLNLYGYELLYRKPCNLSEDFYIVQKAVEYISKINSGDKKYHVNISPKTLEKFRKINLNGHSEKIMFEIVESDESQLKRLNKIIKDLNINIVIDDFGTGFSNIDLLLHIKNLKMVKYERIFWKNFNGAVIETVEHLKERGIKTLAEKVETEEEFKQALDMGFEYFQGYFFNERCRKWTL